jgi:diadenosine tetraphosphate (Ap4A) HIT family hydrolase
MRYRFPIQPRCFACDLFAGGHQDEYFIVAENETTVTTLTNEQRSEGSVLVFSRRHVCTFAELTAWEAADFLRAVRDIAIVIERAFAPEALHSFINMGLAARQSLDHLHMQVVPRYENRPYTYASSDTLPSIPLEERRRQLSLLQHYLQ